MRSFHRFQAGLMANVCHAVVEVYGSGYKTPTSDAQAKRVFAEGDYKCINSQITITSGNTALSKYWVADIPTQAIIDPRAFYDFYAATGVNDFDVGFHYPLAQGGADIDFDKLVDGDDISSAGTQTFRGHGTHTLANSNKRVWELCGFARDPGGVVSIVATIKADASATGVVNFTIPYSK